MVLEIRRFLRSYNQEKSLALHNYWTTTSKDWREHDFRVCRGENLCLFSAGCCLSLLSFPSLFLFICYETLVLILQNNPPLSWQFTFKYFNNYFPKKEKYPCIKSSSFDLKELNC